MVISHVVLFACEIGNLSWGILQMQAVLGEKRPNCLVIDEIDGALGDGSSGGASGVRELANILKTGHIASTDKDTSGDGSGVQAQAVPEPHVLRFDFVSTFV